MRIKLLVVFAVSFLIISGFRAYGDYMSGGFPAFGYIDFLWWSLLYSLIPLLPAFLIIQIISNPVPELTQNKSRTAGSSHRLIRILGKVFATAMVIVICGYAGGSIGLMTSSREGLDALTDLFIGAVVGSALGLILCWLIFTRMISLKRMVKKS